MTRKYTLEDFWAWVDRWDPDHCWLWTGARHSGGYGLFRSHSYAHRLAYEMLIGPIPDGLQIDHLCRVRACVNPKHMEPVSQTVNVLRGNGPTAVRARQTHCRHGHPFDAKNTYIRKEGYRMCRACSYRQSEDRRKRNKDRVA